MAIVTTNDKHYKDIADFIREHKDPMTDFRDSYRPEDMKDALSGAFFAERQRGSMEGQQLGYEMGHIDGVAEGKQTEYDRFWNEFQDYGTRTDYTYAFRRWNAEHIRPKYKVQNLTMKAETLFQYSKVQKIEAAYFDLSGIDKLTGTAYGMFNACLDLEEIDDLNIPATDYTGTWANCPKLKKIAVVRCIAGKAFSSAFSKCESLEDVTFTGTMTTNGLDLSACVKLNKESIESVIGILATTSSSRSVTLSEAAVKKAFETSPGKNDGDTSTAWADLVATKPSKWTISLV